MAYRVLYLPEVGLEVVFVILKPSEWAVLGYKMYES